MKFSKKIENIKSFTLSNDLLFLSDGKKVWVDSTYEEVIVTEENLQSLKNINNNVFVNTIFGKGYIINPKTSICLNEPIQFLNNDFYITFERKNESKNTLFKSLSGKVNETFIKGSSTIFLVQYNRYFRKNFENNLIEAFSFPTAQPLWEFSLEDLGSYEDIEGKTESYEVVKFLGIYQSNLLVACTGRLIVELDIRKGTLLRSWQQLKGFGDKAFGGRLLDKIPDAENFQLNTSKTELYNLSGKHLTIIDLGSGEASFVSLQKTMHANHISNFRYSTGYAEDEAHLYTIGEMDKAHFNTDYTPQCILAFNKTTLAIDWLHVFKNDWVKTDIPQIAENKLYQLTGYNTLYIFEKEIL